ncbi:MAG: DNA polymerase III subunit alpha [candidate division KSB1 bacterium]|nr:DNA polymerase III subunit alpha [candidate division KSB1 bacterium]
MDFVHLHNHSHYSLLDGACRIPDLIDKALSFNMSALALTDHGNMFGAIEFYKACRQKGIRPIIGAEVYVAPGSRFDKGSDKKEGRAYHLVLLCKDERGYHNLIKLVSAGYLEGFYYKPRIDEELLRRHHEGLVALSACLKGEAANALLNQGFDKALEVVQKYRDIFGEDFYLEVQNHGLAEEETVREGMYRLAAQTGVKAVATNDIHYLEKEHWEAHDILLCLQTGKDYDDPNRMRYQSHELYFKSQEEMAALFADHPEVLESTLEVAEKCQLELTLGQYKLPNFTIPEGDDSKTLGEYLRKLAFEGLKKRYDPVTTELVERLEYELSVISRMGYEGYFLITQDFIQYAKNNDIPVGPGRGSAAGSLTAYCLGITDLDPIRYDLYFERFLNPDRISMPDIDIDFCYERRGEVIDYVKKKYGEGSVCQIITFGTMAARAVVRDVGRVLKMSYSEVDRIAKMIPAQAKNLQEALDTVKELKEIAELDDQHRKLIQHAQVLEGLARHASIHAAGVVIAPGDLTDYIPLYKSKEGFVTTQYEMSVLDDVGMLKMDFLGLRTLTVIKRTVDAVRARGIDIDLKTLPLDDPKVYKLFSEGQTVGIFQFESSGMQEYLRKLKPNCIEDLIAMNALYRPGPMNMIDDFIDRKYGRKKIEYKHPLLEPILKNTYGVIVYQEQVMRIAVDMAGYAMGGADTLRKVMGKKQIDKMERQREIFVEGCVGRGIPRETAESIFQEMSEFAKYGFNKSHAACYSIVAYQTAFLKTYFPAEFMAATISSEMGSTERVTVFLEECRRMGLKVLPPDINESDWDFVVTEGALRFGLGAIKNVGTAAVEALVAERKKNGPYRSLFDLTRRVDTAQLNRKVLESMIEAGALDSLEPNRARLFAAVEAALEFAQRCKKAESNRLQRSIFDAIDEGPVQIAEPPLPAVADWPIQERLAREKQILGFYLSGHPLDDYRDEIRAFSTVPLEQLAELKDQTTIRICGMLGDLKTHLDRKNQTMAFFKIEDLSGAAECVVFAEVFEKSRAAIADGRMAVVSGKVSVKEGGEAKIIAQEVLTLEDARPRFTRSLMLNLELEQLSEDMLREMRSLLSLYQGDVPLFLKLVTPQNGNYLLKAKNLRVRADLDLLERLRQMVGRQNVWLGV